MKRNLHILILLIFTQNSVFSQNLRFKINGKDSSETAVIDSLSYRKNHLDLISIKKEADSLQKRLFNIGYIENSKNRLSKTNDSSYQIQFDLKKHYKSLRVFFNNEIISDKTIRSISKNISGNYFTIPINKTEDVLNYINSEIANQGKPFSKLRLDNIQLINNIVTAELLIDEDNSERQISNIIIKGYEKFPKTYLKHFLKIKKGDIFNLKKIENKLQNLNNLTFASQKKSPEVLFTKDSSSLYIYVEKQKSNNFDGFLGFGTNETTNKIEFDGYLNLQLTNNLNYGENLSLLYKSDENEQRTIDIKTTLPYILNSPIGIEAQLNLFRKDSTYNISNQSADVFYQISRNQKIFLGIQDTQSSSLLNETSSSNLQDYKSNFYNLKYEFIKTNSESRLFPLNFKFSTSLGIGKREDQNSKQDQYQISLNSFKIFKLNNKNSIFLKIQGELLNSENYLENELRRFGGIQSIRGFEENSIFANLHTTASTEYRYTISNNLYIHSITDIAYFENSINQTKEKLFGIGFGFGLITKSGLLKFNYANGKKQNQEFKFSDSKIHLSLTTSF